MSIKPSSHSEYDRSRYQLCDRMDRLGAHHHHLLRMAELIGLAGLCQNVIQREQIAAHL